MRTWKWQPPSISRDWVVSAHKMYYLRRPCLKTYMSFSLPMLLALYLNLRINRYYFQGVFLDSAHVRILFLSFPDKGLWGVWVLMLLVIQFLYNVDGSIYSPHCLKYHKEPLKQQSENIFCKGPDGKYSRICDLCCNHSPLLL